MTPGTIRTYLLLTVFLAVIINIGFYSIVTYRHMPLKRHFWNFTRILQPLVTTQMDVSKNWSAIGMTNSSQAYITNTPKSLNSYELQIPNSTVQNLSKDAVPGFPRINISRTDINASETLQLLMNTTSRTGEHGHDKISALNPAVGVKVGATERQHNRQEQTPSTTVSPEVPRTHYMTISGGGRLGNQLFQFASLLGIATRLGYTPFLRPSHALRNIFEMDFARNIQLTNVQHVGESKAGTYDIRLEKLNKTVNYSLSGYLQSWKYFHNSSSLIRKVFTFKPHIRTYTDALFRGYGTGNRTVVGVHIRRGDMNTHYEGRRGYQVANIGFINKAMDYFRKKYRDVVFIVVSDDKVWSVSNVKGPDVKLGVGSDAAVDLALLAMCNHTIVTSGTYGWWGAWLAGGDTVYYKDYPKPGSWLDQQYNRRDYYPPHWIPML